MGDDVRTFAVVVATGSTPAAPVFTSLPMPPRVVQSVSVRVPPGPRGQVGWALAMSGVRILPSNGNYIVDDDRTVEWHLENQPDSGAWQLAAYNQGRSPHTVYVTFVLAVPRRGSVPTFAPVEVVA